MTTPTERWPAPRALPLLAALFLSAAGAAAGEDEEGAAPKQVMPLTLQQCIHLAERNSIPVRIEEVNVQIGEAELGSSLGVFDTVFFSSYEYAKAVSPTVSRLSTGNIFAPSTETVVTGILNESHTVTSGFRGSLIGGGSYQADANWVKTERNPVTFGNFNPEYTSGIGLAVTQPLLRGFGSAVSKAGVLTARNALLGAAENLEATREARAEEVVVAYWNHYFAIRNLVTREFLVGQGERLVEINQKKLDVGEFRRIDVVEAESTLATREQERIAAVNEIGRAADALKRLIFPFETREEWEIEVVPLTEAAEEAIERPSWREAARVALERRHELRQKRLQLENDDIRIMVAENTQLPQLDLTASLRFNQLADNSGDVTNYDDDYYSIGAGVNLEVPLGNRTARYDLAAARLTKIRSLLEYKDLENQIIQEVRDAVRDVSNRQEQIVAAGEASRLAKERWVAEQKRQETGYSTTFQVRDAEAAWQESEDAYLRALFDYQVALASLHAAQGTLLEEYGLLPAPAPRLDDRAGVLFDS